MSTGATAWATRTHLEDAEDVELEDREEAEEVEVFDRVVDIVHAADEQHDREEGGYDLELAR